MYGHPTFIIPRNTLFWVFFFSLSSGCTVTSIMETMWSITIKLLLICSFKCVVIGQYVRLAAVVIQHRSMFASSREPPQAIYDAMKYCVFLFFLL